jgi:hypothetical protein
MINNSLVPMTELLINRYSIFSVGVAGLVVEILTLVDPGEPCLPFTFLARGILRPPHKYHQ